MIVDLFAGPGGWDRGLQLLGIDDVIGIEVDPDACLTRRAAGLATIRADVAAVDTATLDDVDGLIASPPCQGMSRAGARDGWLDVPAILEHVHRCSGGWVDPSGHGPRQGHSESLFDDDSWHDRRSTLVLEPLRWTLALRPRWVALEQVQDVLPVWQATAAALERRGYATWCGLLNAADYGVPQTRVRAFMLARCDVDEVGQPKPSHSRDGGPGLKPWVPMAAALGWSAAVADERPETRWCFTRPATTVMGDPRIAQPGHKRDEANPDAPGRMQGAVRVTLDEAKLLQSFPASWPVCGGSQFDQYEQVGNAVPPKLAAALLEPLVG